MIKFDEAQEAEVPTKTDDQADTAEVEEDSEENEGGAEPAAA